MTTRELRQMLFEIVNQNLTVRELRAILFAIQNQDDELTVQDLRKLLIKAEEE